MFKWISKKYLMKKVNGLLGAYRGDVEKFRETVTKWAARLRNILACLESALEKLDDGRLDEDEVGQTVDAVRELVGRW